MEKRGKKFEGICEINNLREIESIWHSSYSKTKLKTKQKEQTTIYMITFRAVLLNLFYLYRHHRDIVVKFYGFDKLIQPVINAFDDFFGRKMGAFF